MIDDAPETAEELALLTTRAQRLRRRGAGEAAEEAVVWLAELSLGDERFAFPLEAMRAVVPLKRLTPVPMAAAHVIGILRFQGQVISALSLPALLGGRAWRADPSVLLVVEGAGGSPVALDCEGVPRPLAIASHAWEQAMRERRGPVGEIIVAGAPVGLIHLPTLLTNSAEPRHGR